MARPRSRSIPSGKFVYVVNQLSNSISAYSINATTGALASIDADALTAGLQTSIPTELTPVAIAIDPAGTYAYVASLGQSLYSTVCGRAVVPANGCISAYSIDASTGALTAIDATGTSGLYRYG